MSEASDTPIADECGLTLDARQRAMLEEMGVKVWWPATRAVPGAAHASEAASDAAAGAPAPEADAGSGRAVSAGPRPAVPPATAPASPPVPTARRAASTSGASGAPSRGAAAVLFDVPRRLYEILDEDGIATAPAGGWLVVADMPPEADGCHGEPFAGEAGRLLDNMLRALQLHDGAAAVHLVRTHRGVASGRDGGPRPLDEGFATLAQRLAPRIVLAMGPLAAQSLLQSGEPLGRLRGKVSPLAAFGDGLAGVPVVATYHPAYLLRNPADKARAWADLCLAADRFAPA